MAAENDLRQSMTRGKRLAISLESLADISALMPPL